MRRGTRQKTNGAENDWLDKRMRRNIVKSGRGKYSKRQMARRRRREPIDADA
jgi:hypothetical protein